MFLRLFHCCAARRDAIEVVCPCKHMQVNALFVFLSPTFSVLYAFWCAVIFSVCTESPVQWALLRVVCACAHAYELLGALMLLVCCRAIEVNRTFFFLSDYNFYVCSISACCCLCIDATACTFLFLFFFKLLYRLRNTTRMQK